MSVACGLVTVDFSNIFQGFFTVNSLRPRRNSRYNADDIFKWIFLNENVWIPIKISLKFVPKGPINNIPALVQIMAWRRSGDKPLSEPMMVSLLTHICVTRPQWVDCPSASKATLKNLVDYVIVLTTTKQCRNNCVHIHGILYFTMRW